MKPASPALIALLENATELPFADCFTITFLNGTVGRYTNLDVPVSSDGNMYLANSVRIDGLKYKCSVGVDIDEQDITIIAGPNDLLNGVPWLQAIREMVLDDAQIERNRAFFTPTAFAAARVSGVAVAVGSVNLFTGRVADIKSVGDTTADVNVKSGLVLLDIDFPRNIYQASCLHTLFDSGCGLNKNSYQKSGAVGAGATYNIIPFAQGGSGAAAHAIMAGSAGAAIAKVALTSAANVNASYTKAPVITVVDPGGTGSGAILKPLQSQNFHLGGWGFYGIAVVNGGANYGPNSHVVITAASGDTGSGSTAQIVFANGGQSLNGIGIDAGGAHYSPAAQFVISGAGGSGAAFNPIITGGVITGATLINSGSGYSSAPSVTVVDGVLTNYSQGTILFTSGQNSGVARQIQTANSSSVMLVQPLDYICAAGDTFNIWPGCDHTTGAGGCGKYNNLPNYRGFPFVPPPEVAY